MKKCRNWRTAGVFVVLAASLLAARPAQAQSADERALAEYRLTMDKVDKYTAVLTKMFGHIRANPALAKEVDVEPNLTLDQMARKIDSSPELSAAMGEAGTTSRDFILTQFALFQATMVVGFRKAGSAKDLPPGISQQNVAFYEQNEAEIIQKLETVQRMAREIEAVARRARDEPEEDQEEAAQDAMPPRD
jgi:hypothetical protein